MKFVNHPVISTTKNYHQILDSYSSMAVARSKPNL